MSTERTTVPAGAAAAAEPTTEPILETVDVRRRFGEGEAAVDVLDGVDLRVEHGEFVALMGASGSGKSTLLHAMSGMDRPTAGEVRLEGRPLTDLGDAELARIRLTRMGFVFQQAHFLEHLSLRDNVLLPALHAAPRDEQAVVARVDGLLERFGVAHVAHHGVTRVSGGQLQRAAICRALATRPAVLFADEPTGALNRRTAAEVMDAFSDVHADGTTIVMVTHSPTCAARADRVRYLRDGGLAGELELGRWTADAAAEREGVLLDWLRGLGF